MTETLFLEEYLKEPGVVFDVRSPKEYSQGRIPGAVNLPLFTDVERASVGTLYKQQGKEQAIDLGLRIVGPKLSEFSTQAKSLAQGSPANIHCWRGGMRSAAMAWLLDLVGLKTIVLKGGYKTFRFWTSKVFSQPYRLHVVGGMTGSGKTSILKTLEAMGEQVIDIEALANHRGSSFGMLGMAPQPSTEQFENEIAIRLAAFEKERPIWIEDESRQIGTCNFPCPLFNQLARAPLFIIELPLQERIEHLMEDYSHIAPDLLINATLRISKRLGSQRTKEIIECINEGHLRDAIVQVLKYYDDAYTYSLTKRYQEKTVLSGNNLSTVEWAERILTSANTLFSHPLKEAL